MIEALAQMLARYECRRVEDTTRALREILQELALLGLWRAKFFEKAAFYGGTALRILHGLDRFSEDLDFSLLRPMSDFRLDRYSEALERELAAFGFKVRLEVKDKAIETPVQSAFLKADTANVMLVIQAGEPILRQIPGGQIIRIKIEVDTDPPPDFETENRFILLPIPFSVRSYRLPDLFAGKMHAVLCRRWKNRVKGRDWYDLVWYCARHPELHLLHLEQRMRQSGHWSKTKSLGPEQLRGLMAEAVGSLDVEQARKEVLPFVKNSESLDLWSREFFLDVAGRVRCV
ncbi:MAG: nucleotidyl transferase AbiEii/AbiGii toxin family protein [Deltaproteobacteria bacterium]|nr:nucleotidyl transferase AbiEii/AbiGii toxin family protein [Deltaproteobacteria bacterium]